MLTHPEDPGAEGPGPSEAEEPESSSSSSSDSSSSDSDSTSSEEETDDEGPPRKLARRGAAPPRARDLAPHTAALLDILSLPSLQQALQAPRLAPQAAARLVASLGTALGSPRHPGVQQLLLSLWEPLEPARAVEPAAAWQADLPRTLGGFNVDSKVPPLKALCRAFSLPVTGNKRELQARLRDVLPILPQRVPLRAALALQPDLARKIKARAALTALAEPGGAEAPKGMYFFWGAGKIAATKAKTEFCLGDADLKELRYTLSSNPMFRGGPPMRLYELKDVQRAAILRHGSLEGVEEAKKKSAARGTAIKQSKEGKITARRAEAYAELEARGLSRLKHSLAMCEYVEEKRGGPKTLEAAIAAALQDEQAAREQAERRAQEKRRQADERAAQAERRADLLARLMELGLEGMIDLPACKSYVAGMASSSGLHGVLEGCILRHQRQTQLLARLTKAGLTEAELADSIGLPACQEYIANSARTGADAAAAMQGVVEGCVARLKRQEELLSSLAEVGLVDKMGVPCCQAYISGAAGAGTELQAVVEEAVAQDGRRQELIATLVARGLPTRLCDTHKYCTDYIEKGKTWGMDVPYILRVVSEDHFYNTATSYNSIYKKIEKRDAPHRYEYPDEFEGIPIDEIDLDAWDVGFVEGMQNEAKERALYKFVRKHGALAACLANPRLPPHLEKAVRKAWGVIQGVRGQQQQAPPPPPPPQQQQPQQEEGQEEGDDDNDSSDDDEEQQESEEEDEDQE